MPDERTQILNDFKSQLQGRLDAAVTAFQRDFPDPPVRTPGEAVDFRPFRNDEIISGIYMTPDMTPSGYSVVQTKPLPSSAVQGELPAFSGVVQRAFDSVSGDQRPEIQGSLSAALDGILSGLAPLLSDAGIPQYLGQISGEIAGLFGKSMDRASGLYYDIRRMIMDTVTGLVAEKYYDTQDIQPVSSIVPDGPADLPWKRRLAVQQELYTVHAESINAFATASPADYKRIVQFFKDGAASLSDPGVIETLNYNQLYYLLFANQKIRDDDGLADNPALTAGFNQFQSQVVDIDTLTGDAVYSAPDPTQDEEEAQDPADTASRKLSAYLARPFRIHEDGSVFVGNPEQESDYDDRFPPPAGTAGDLLGKYGAALNIRGYMAESGLKNIVPFVYSVPAEQLILNNIYGDDQVYIAPKDIAPQQTRYMDAMPSEDDRQMFLRLAQAFCGYQNGGRARTRELYSALNADEVYNERIKPSIIQKYRQAVQFHDRYIDDFMAAEFVDPGAETLQKIGIYPVSGGMWARNLIRGYYDSLSGMPDLSEGMYMVDLKRNYMYAGDFRQVYMKYYKLQKVQRAFGLQQCDAFLPEQTAGSQYMKTAEKYDFKTDQQICRYDFSGSAGQFQLVINPSKAYYVSMSAGVLNFARSPQPQQLFGDSVILLQKRGYGAQVTFSSGVQLVQRNILVDPLNYSIPNVYLLVAKFVGGAVRLYSVDNWMYNKDFDMEKYIMGDAAR